MESNRKKEFIEKNSMFPIDGRELSLKDYFKEEDFIQEDDNIFVKLDALHRVSRKVFHRIISLDTEVKQYIEKVNDFYAVVKATIELETKNDDGQYTKFYRYSANADCYKGNAPNGKTGKYYTCIAESRAISRVLRNVLGIQTCSVEEVAEIDLNSVISTNGPIEPAQKMLIERKFMTEKEKGLEDISKIVGKPVLSVDVLTKEEATLVIQNFNKGK